jgi:hypothetical protein
MKITCPTGFSFDARKWLFGDLKQLMNKSEDTIFVYLLDCAFQEVIEPGPYPFKDRKRIDFLELSFADIMAAIIDIRKITRSQYQFSIPCKYCNNVEPLEIDLNEQETLPASSEGIHHLATNEPICHDIKGIAPRSNEDTLHKVYFKILRGRDMSLITRLTKQDKSGAIDLQTALSIDKIIDGSNPGGDPISGVRNIRKFIETQPWDFKEALDDVTTDLEGGYDPIVSFTCSECRRYQDTLFPLGESFFGTDPIQAAKKRRKRFMAQASGKTNT